MKKNRVFSEPSEKITIILPCAGEGSRLGLADPKELYMIRPGVRLIDFSLAHINAYPFKEQLRVVVVIKPGKQDVSDYTADRLPGIRVDEVLFDENYSEWPGSVFSANALYSGKNLVLLPDSFLSLAADIGGIHTRDAEGCTLVELAREALSKHKVVFGAIPCSDAAILANMGAMRVEGGLVTAFQDKPGADLERFNSFWGCYGFQQDCSEELYCYLIRSVRHQPLQLNGQTFFPPGAIPVKTYYDLGTWENIGKFRLK